MAAACRESRHGMFCLYVNPTPQPCRVSQGKSRQGFLFSFGLSTDFCSLVHHKQLLKHFNILPKRVPPFRCPCRLVTAGWGFGGNNLL
jgi:hypothetical protein